MRDQEQHHTITPTTRDDEYRPGECGSRRVAVRPDYRDTSRDFDRQLDADARPDLCEDPRLIT